MNRLPVWFESLALRYPHVVDEVLGNELKAELEEPAGAQSYSILLQHITAAPSSVTAIFLPRVLQWTETTDVSVQENDELGAASARLTRALAFLLASGDAVTIARVRELAQTRLKRGLDTDFAVEWMKVAMRLDPEFAVPILESALDASTAESRDAAVKWFAVLFGDRHNSLMVSPTDPPFNAELLLRLVRLAYVYVARDADVEHDGAYTPGVRDDAESARNALLGALLDLPGVEGRNAKLRLADDPNIAHFRDRAIAIARERSAEEVDAVHWQDSEVAALDALSEAAPKTREDMFALLRDRLDDLDDSLRQDSSPREMWAREDREYVLRRAIAASFENMARGAYVVAQEAATGEEKETDIRLRSASSDQEAVIELKLGDKYSVTELRDALRDQLAQRYMAHRERRAGCLMITCAGRKHWWEHPDSGKRIKFAELVELLAADARGIEETSLNAVRLIVWGLDLRLPGV